MEETEGGSGGDGGGMKEIKKEVERRSCISSVPPVYLIIGCGENCLSIPLHQSSRFSLHSCLPLSVFRHLSRSLLFKSLPLPHAVFLLLFHFLISLSLSLSSYLSPISVPFSVSLHSLISHLFHRHRLIIIDWREILSSNHHLLTFSATQLEDTDDDHELLLMRLPLKLLLLLFADDT